MLNNSRALAPTVLCQQRATRMIMPRPKASLKHCNERRYSSRTTRRMMLLRQIWQALLMRSTMKSDCIRALAIYHPSSTKAFTTATRSTHECWSGEMGAVQLLNKLLKLRLRCHVAMRCRADALREVGQLIERSSKSRTHRVTITVKERTGKSCLLEMALEASS